MSPERVHAYRRVIQTIADLGPSKLLDGEQDQIRHAADNLIFSHDLGDDVEARESLSAVERLLRDLVDGGRWEHVTATRLADDVSQCGPPPPVELKAA